MIAFDGSRMLATAIDFVDGNEKTTGDRWLKMERETRLELATFSLGS